MAESSEGNSETSSDEKHNLILQFQEITGKDDEQECKRRLEERNWNLEAAVQSLFNENEGNPVVYDNHGDSRGGKIEEMIVEPAHLQGPMLQTHEPQHRVVPHRQGWLDTLKAIITSPFTVARISYHFTYHVISELLSFFISIVSPGSARAITKPIDDVVQFKREYEEVYGDEHPTFYQGSYQQVLSDAKKELKFLLVYLHSNNHQDTPDFCREVLADEKVVGFVNSRMLFWGCDVKLNEGARVSRAMKETTYPYLGCVCLRDTRMTLVWRIEGSILPEQLVGILTKVMEDNEASLIAERVERQERSMTQNLRVEQDLAFTQSLEKDRLREQEREKEREDARKAEEEKARKEKEKQAKKQGILNEREECRRIMEDWIQPKPGDEGAILIRVKLPSGTQLKQYFLKTTTLDFVYKYVLAEPEAPAHFTLCTNFPRKTFPRENNEMTSLGELGIVNTTAMFCSPNDSSESESDGE